MMSYFGEVETEKPHKGYSCSIKDTVTITILGSLCGLKNVSQIHQGAVSEHIRSFLKEKWAIEKIPCCYGMLCPMKIIKQESLNECFERWTASLLPEGTMHLTIAMEGKTVRATESMAVMTTLFILSARICQNGGSCLAK